MIRQLRVQSKTPKRMQRRPIRHLVSSFVLIAALALPSCIQNTAQDAQPQASGHVEKRRAKRAKAPKKAPLPRLPEYNEKSPLPEIAKTLFSRESITCEKGKNKVTYKQDRIRRFFGHRSDSLNEPEKLISKLPYPEQAALYRRILQETDQQQLIGMANYLDKIGVVEFNRINIREAKARIYLRLENPFESEHFNTECMTRAGIAFRAETLCMMRLIDLCLEQDGEGLNDIASNLSIFQSMIFHDRLAIKLFKWRRDFDPRFTNKMLQKLNVRNREIFFSHLYDFIYDDSGLHRTYRTTAWDVRRVTSDKLTRQTIFDTIREVDYLQSLRD